MRLIAFILGWQVAFTLAAAEPDTNLLSGDALPETTALKEGPDDVAIVKTVAQILQRQHYLRLPINDELSSRFLDRYLDSLDNLHIYFLQSDVQEFEKYRYKLDDFLLESGDTSVARLIFSRFRQRLEQQFEYVQELLKQGKWDFAGDDRFTLDRKKLPRPRDFTEARQLWRDRLRYEYLDQKLSKVDPEEITKTLTRRYRRVIRMIREYDNDDVLEAYLTALAHVYDPHSDYMGKSQLENFSITMKLSLFGIGAVLESPDGICKIRSLTDGGPAKTSNQVHPEDKILAVAQSNQPPVDVVDMKLSKVVELIRGPKGTEVRLTINPADAPNSSVRKVVTLIRDEIKLEESAAKARIFETPDGKEKDKDGHEKVNRIGLIDLPSFYSSFELEGRKSAGEPKSTTADVAKLLRKLVQEKVTGVILDLRRNGGGSLEEAINLTGLFIKDGPIVQVKDFDEQVFVDNDPDSSVWYDGPLIVLTSRFSASASEILAGALQDYGRALIVGDSSTHGKGTVQSLLQLGAIMRQSGIPTSGNPGALKITIRKFYRASGSSTQLRGVIPDLVLPSVNNYIEVGEAFLDNPLQWDPIQPATYQKLNRVQPYLVALRRSSNLRLETDPDYIWVRQEIDRFKKLQAEKSVSLNESVRLAEKKESDDRAKARKKELASRPEPPGKIYDITLKLADQPGLPPPTVRTNTSTAGVKADPKSLLASKDDGKAKAKTVKKSEAGAKADKDDEGDDEDDAKAPSVDITVDETRRILLDYITLLNNNKGVVSTQPAPKRPQE